MTQPSRDIRLRYGPDGGTDSFDSDDAGYQVFADWDYDDTYPRSAFTARVLVTGSTNTEYESRKAALVTAFRTRNQRLRLTSSKPDAGVDVVDLDPRSGSGRNALRVEPFCRNLGGRQQSLFSGVFEVGVECERVADEDGKKGRQSARISVTTMPTGQQRLVVTGTWTAVGGTDARAKYEAEIDDYVTSIKNDLGGNWFDLDDDAVTEQEDHVLEFRREAIERILGGSTLHTHDAIGDAVLTMVPRRAARSYALSETSPPYRVVVRYDADVKVDQSQELWSLWDGTLRPAILQHVRSTLGTGTVAVTSEDPGLRHSRNRIEAQVELMVLGGGGVIASAMTMIDNESTGVRYRPVLDGDPHSKDRLQGTALWTRTVTVTTLELSSGKGGGGSYPTDSPGGAGGSGIPGIEGEVHGELFDDLITRPGQGPGAIFGGGKQSNIVEKLTTTPGQGPGAIFAGGGDGGSGNGRLTSAPGFADPKSGQFEAWQRRTKKEPRIIGIPGTALQLIRRSETTHLIFFKQGRGAGGGGGGAQGGAGGSISGRREIPQD